MSSQAVQNHPSHLGRQGKPACSAMVHCSLFSFLSSLHLFDWVISPVPAVLWAQRLTSHSHGQPIREVCPLGIDFHSQRAFLPAEARPTTGRDSELASPLQSGPHRVATLSQVAQDCPGFSPESPPSWETPQSLTNGKGLSPCPWHLP